MARKKSSKGNGVTATLSNAADSVKEKAAELGGAVADKAGKAVAGFEKVKEWLASGHARVLLQACDGSDRGKGKLWTPPGGRWFGCLTASELGLSFGRDHVIHSALAPGGLTEKLIRDASRLTGLRGHDGGNAAAGKE